MQTNTPIKAGVKIGKRSIVAFNLLAIISKQKRFVKLTGCAIDLRCSVSYLEQIARALKAAGILKARTGPGGGFRLALLPKDITVGRVITIIEGPNSLETAITKAMGEIIMIPLYQTPFSAVLEKAKTYSEDYHDDTKLCPDCRVTRIDDFQHCCASCNALFNDNPEY